ncbi:hypothetical protein GQ55_3G136700 [Panicum hallii var. hallii]|uniref:Uncharacterized protein n=1 Tax=Panicum hallii var. hallii TaxID=1504633 RepID=A0A2T7E930_9POAL|nr:hypothetical protein GQ55_3G136700 [Panicum hallii var. hallii]
MCLIALLEFDTSDSFRIKLTFVHKQFHAPPLHRHATNAENRPVQQQLQIISLVKMEPEIRADLCIGDLMHRRWPALPDPRKGTRTIGKMWHFTSHRVTGEHVAL